MPKNPFKIIALRTIVEEAIIAEERSFQFYSSAAERMPAETAGLLKELAGEELKHRMKLEELKNTDPEKLMDQIDSQESFHQPSDSTDSSGTTEIIPPDADEHMILEIAAERERSHSEYYANMAESIRLEEVKSLFHYLSLQEREHFQVLQKRISSISS